MDGVLPAGYGEAQRGGAGVDEAEVLGRYVAGEEQERLCGVPTRSPPPPRSAERNLARKRGRGGVGGGQCKGAMRFPADLLPDPLSPVRFSRVDPAGPWRGVPPATLQARYVG